MEFHIHPEKGHVYFYKNSTNQTFTFISSKVVYFKKYHTSTASLGNEVSTTVKYSDHRQTIKFAAGPMAEPHPT